MTRRLPAPVQAVADAALRFAVRRWPLRHRDELAAEWAAELHAIVHDPSSGAARRCWRSLGYTTSLVLARGVDHEPEGGPLPMTSHWRPITLVLTAPLVIGLVQLTLMSVALAPLTAAETMGWDSYLGESLLDTYTTLAVLVPVLVVGLVAWWLGGREALRPPAHRLRVPFTALAIAAAVLFLLGVGVGGLGIGDERGPAVAGTVVWAAALTVAMTGTAWWWGRGRRRIAALAAGLGGVLAVNLGVTTHLLLNSLMSTAPLGYLPLWFPASLWTGVLPLEMGWTTNDETVAYAITDITELQPYLLLALTAFILGYLYPRRERQPVAPEPAPDLDRLLA